MTAIAREGSKLVPVLGVLGLQLLGGPALVLVGSEIRTRSTTRSAASAPTSAR